MLWKGSQACHPIRSWKDAFPLNAAGWLPRQAPMRCSVGALAPWVQGEQLVEEAFGW